MTRILVVHDLSHYQRETTREFVSSFGRYAPPGVDVVYQHVRRPLGREIARGGFEALFMTYDVLSLRSSPQWPWASSVLARARDACDACVAFPQDDYTFNAVLDASLAELDTGVIYTPIETGLDVVYPTMHQRAEIRHAYTGYVDTQLAARRRSRWVPFSKRTIDVGQRVRMLPPWFGRSGREKGLFAERFAAVAERAGLRVDISTRDQDAFSGEAWYGFLGRCRATIGQKGGASLCDPHGEIALRCTAYLEEHPDAGFDEVEAACFAGLDGRAEMKAISPRLFDAATMGTAQVLIEDDYLGVLEPWVHYLPTDDRVSNIDELAQALRDDAFLARMVDAAAAVLTESERFTYATFVESVLSSRFGRAPHELRTELGPRVGVDVAEELQWRLSPDLFEGLQRLASLARATGASAALAAVADRVAAVLGTEPELVRYLDHGLLTVLDGEPRAHPALDRYMVPTIDLFRECARAGALRPAIEWIRNVEHKTRDDFELLTFSEPFQLDLHQEPR